MAPTATAGNSLYTGFHASEFWVHFPLVEQELSVHPMDHPRHNTVEGLALTCCMWSHMGQQSKERAGEPV